MRRTIIALVLTAAVLVGVLLYRSPPVSAPAVKQIAPSPSPAASSAAQPSPAAATGMFTGTRVQAYQRKMGYVFGDVQVVVTMRSGRIVTIATPIAPPDGDTGGAGTRPTTQSITAYAMILLKSEAISAQSAQIHTVSGATYTSDAFISSLQAALHLAGR